MSMSDDGEEMDMGAADVPAKRDPNAELKALMGIAESSGSTKDAKSAVKVDKFKDYEEAKKVHGESRPGKIVITEDIAKEFGMLSEKVSLIGLCSKTLMLRQTQMLEAINPDNIPDALQVIIGSQVAKVIRNNLLWKLSRAQKQVHRQFKTCLELSFSQSQLEKKPHILEGVRNFGIDTDDLDILPNTEEFINHAKEIVDVRRRREVKLEEKERAAKMAADGIALPDPDEAVTSADASALLKLLRSGTTKSAIEVAAGGSSGLTTIKEALVKKMEADMKMAAKMGPTDEAAGASW